MNEKLKEKVKESLSSVLPITLIVLVLSITLVPMEIGTLALFLTGAVLLIFGMGFFQLGAEMSMTPLGEGVGKTLAKREKVILVVLVSFALGTIITIAEPDLQVLANQVASIPNNVLIWTVAVGVGVFLALAVLRIFHRASLAKCLLIAYALLFALTLFSPKDFLAVAFDAGGVTTGPITVPFIMALGVGVSALRAAQGHDDDSFGLVALFSVGPILLVLLLGTGVFLTIRLRFLQFRGWRTILKRTFGSLKEKPAGENRTALTQFQTFSTALAAAMGTGNIIGVAAALCIGGPGAVFWMWFSALLGMALPYSENVLALRYARPLPDGSRVSGPMAYLRFGLHSRVLAAF